MADTGTTATATAPATAAPAEAAAGKTATAAPAAEGTATPATTPAQTGISDGTKPAEAPKATPPADGKTDAAATDAAAQDAGKKPDEKAKPQETTPVELKKDDLKLPEGSLLDVKTVDGVLEFAKANKLSKEAAQAVLDRENTAVKSYADGIKAQLSQVQTAWTEEARSDKEFGGDQFGANVECANRVFKMFGTDGFRKLLDETKAGNHPDVLKVFNRIGRRLGVMDDGFVVPDGLASRAKLDPAKALYGKTNDKEK